MASYQEIRDLANDSAMLNKVDVAVLIAANNLLAGTPTADQQKWAANVFASPRVEANKAYRALLAEYNTATVATITGADDATIQTAVDAVVPTLVIAFNAV